MPNYRIVYKIDDFAHMIEVKAPDKETAMKNSLELGGKIIHVDQERILCPAIHYENSTIGYQKRPRNIARGLVLCGYRHDRIIAMYHGLTGNNTKSSDVQGFLTSFEMFVTREDAAQIAFDAGQIPELVKQLYSEDLY